MSEEKTENLKGRAPTQDEVALYDALMKAMQAETARRPSIKNIHIIAILSRAIGYCIGMCFLEERERARKVAIENMDRAVEGFKSLLEAQENVQN